VNLRSDKCISIEKLNQLLFVVYLPWLLTFCSTEVGAGKRIPEQGYSYMLPATFASLDPGGDVNQAQHLTVYHPKAVESYILYVQTTDDVVTIPMPQTANDGALLKGFLRLVERYLAPQDLRTMRDGFVLRTMPDAEVVTTTILLRENNEAAAAFIELFYSLEAGDIVWMEAFKPSRGAARISDKASLQVRRHHR
jgi:glyoxylate utilization-related uncharacterized protein